MIWFTEELFSIPRWAWIVIFVGIFCILMAIVIITCTCVKKGDDRDGEDAPEPVLMDGDAEQGKREEVKTEETKKEKKQEVVYTEPEPVLVEEPVQPIKKDPAKTNQSKNKSSAKTGEKPAAKTAAKSTEKKPAAKSENAAKSTAAKSEKTAAKSTAKTAAKPSKAEDSDNKVYHISKRKEDKKWQVKAEGSAKALKLFFTQDEAIDYAKSVAGNQEGRIVIHKEDGGFRKLKY